MRAKVLIIDGNEHEARSLASSLAAAAVEVTDESAALARLDRGERFDLVLCDLPPQRSAQLSAALRALSSVEGTTLAVISHDAEESEAFSAAGVTVLDPHVRSDDLLALLHFAVSQAAHP